MPLANISCEFFDRGFPETLLLLPGWATDCRIFSLNLDYNYLFAAPNFFLHLENFPALLKHFSLQKVSILGWSMGGFAAYHLGLTYPEKIKGITLAGIRKKYSENELDEMRTAVQRNKKGALYQFYKNCFSPGETNRFIWFKKNLLDQYIAEFQEQRLLEGLEYLRKSEISGAPYPLPLHIIHGGDDKIAPCSEAITVANSLPDSHFSCVEGAGHVVFLHPRFKEIFRELQ